MYVHVCEVLNGNCISARQPTGSCKETATKMIYLTGTPTLLALLPIPRRHRTVMENSSRSIPSGVSLPYCVCEFERRLAERKLMQQVSRGPEGGAARNSESFNSACIARSSLLLCRRRHRHRCSLFLRLPRPRWQRWSQSYRAAGSIQHFVRLPTGHF